MANPFDTIALPDGCTVGVLGGSFDPPHAGHANISKAAMKRFGLSRVMWLFSPGNPLKPRPPAPLDVRAAAARNLLHDPRILLSDFEAVHHTVHTAQTLNLLMARWPRVRFVWLMGADNLVQLHQWTDWRQIMESVPVGVLARPGQRLAARNSVAARVYRDARLPKRDAKGLALCGAPAWCMINIPMSDQSSTRIRQGGAWPVSPQSQGG